MRRPRAVTDGYATCTKEAITQVRTRILENFTKLTQSKQEFLPRVKNKKVVLLGESSNFIERVSGKAVSDARLGTNTDLAMFTWQENVRVMVVNTRTLS